MLFIAAVSWSLICLTGASLGAHSSDPHPSPHWLISFISNAFGYSLILLPAAVLVLFVKSNSCPPQIRHCYLIRLFVFGKESHEHVDVEQQDVSDSEDEKLSASGSLDRVAENAFISNRVVVFTCCFMGLQFSYLLWGLLQEKVMTTKYMISGAGSHSSNYVSSLNQTESTFTPVSSSDSSSSSSSGSVIRTFQFHDSQFLVLVNRVLAFVVALTVMIAKKHFSRKRVSSYKKLPSLRSGKKEYSIAPLYEFSFCSISNILSSWCQYEALKYVNFPTQVLSKACKLLPVMIMSSLISGKKYRPREYVVVIVISCGMFLFLIGNQHEKDRSKSHNMMPDATHHVTPAHDSGPLEAVTADHSDHRRFSLMDGIMILTLYLSFDSFTSNWQEKLNSSYQVSPLQMMAVVNCFSILLTITSLAQQSHLIPSLLLVLSNASLAQDCFLMSLSSATGQLLIFYTISKFGALAFTFIMTLRQVFAIILSCLVYGHPLNQTAIAGIFIVFVGLFAQIYFKSRKTMLSNR